MAPPGAHVPLRFLRAALKKGIQLIKHKLSNPGGSSRLIAQLQPVLAQNTPTRPIDRIKVARRWYTTHVRRLLDAAAINPYPAHLTGKASARISAHAGRAASAFGTTLRPRLGGGALPRTAGGYSLGGHGARYFSHGAVAPAEVVSQVSRAFWMHGQKVGGGEHRRTRGTGGRAGVRAQLAAQLGGDGSGGAAAGGAWVDFDMSPTFTALSHFRGSTTTTTTSSSSSLANPATLELLSHDFATIVNDATAVLADIKRLATLGDLPVALAADRADTIRVHFPACDRATVEALCLEVGVTRGVVGEPAAPAARFAFELLMPQLDFSMHHHHHHGAALSSPSVSASVYNAGDGVGLMMPAAAAAAMQQSPLAWSDMLTPASPAALHESLSQSDEGGRWLSELSSVDGAAYFGDACTHSSLSPVVEDVSSGSGGDSSDLDGPGVRTPSQGSSGGDGGQARSIYAFLEQCDEYSRGVRGPVWG